MLDLIDNNVFWSILLIVHGLISVALLGALTHQTFALHKRQSKNQLNFYNRLYYIWVDLYNTLVLCKDVPIASSSGGEVLMALVNGQMVNLRVPNPFGFFMKNVDNRIDNPAADWKGRGLWTTSGTRTNFHSDDGNKESNLKVFKVLIRPNPLAF